MVKVNQEEFSGQHSYLRYAYYLLSSFRYVSFRTWKSEGEPNPFVQKDLRPRQTHRVEIDNILKDNLQD